MTSEDLDQEVSQHTHNNTHDDHLMIQLGIFPEERVTENVQKSSQEKNQCSQPEVRSKLTSNSGPAYP
jgi:hypothetical protein